MSEYNLENYETVKERKKRFYEKFPDGSIIVECLNIEKIMEHALFKAIIFRNSKEQAENIIFSTGFAHEIRDTEKKITKTGKTYESVNYTSWVENCEESAVGRALDNAGFSGNNKCSREEMKKVELINEKKEIKVTIEEKKEMLEILSKVYEKLTPKLQEYFTNITTPESIYLKKDYDRDIKKIKELNGGNNENKDNAK